METWLVLLTFCTILHTTVCGILYPRESESREVVPLDGIWKFCTSPAEDQEKGFRNKWFSTDLEEWIPMPVPSSYNDITVNSVVRDFIGWTWYQRQFYTPKRWWLDKQRVVLRFGSVHYTAIVWVNGKKACKHSGGHLPFEADITTLLFYGTANLVTVAVNSTLTLSTLPQGYVQHPNDTRRYPPGYALFHYDFDFFNYAGIHRPVYLYTTPQTYIDDITVTTDIHEDVGIVKYTVEYQNKLRDPSSVPQCTVTVFAKDGTKVTSVTGVSGKVHIPKANFWWPYLTNPSPGYLYTLEICLTSEIGKDVYRLPVGVRKIAWNSTTFFINNMPTYFRGFGKHEDSNLRGKGLDYALLIRDYNLIAWLGANAYRTSHYPYAEEALDMADALGIMIIDESPACTIDNFSEELLQKHKEVMTDFVRRDKNRPSVVMWSLANEPSSFRNESREYFSALVNLTKSLDPTRPVTFVTSQTVDEDKAVQFMDIICINRYPAWYSDSGRTDLIQLQVKNELVAWHLKFNKPVLVTEYGAGSVIGMHTAPSSMWTEDYQVVTLTEHFKAFDTLYKEGFLIGEMIWNFADFATPQVCFYRIYSSWRVQERSVYSGTTTKNGSPYHPLALLDTCT
ncbi:beta-glucuronidase isoform X2 [Cryptotermes secundus]|uniref:beta-glucuronidase isoform X2 n=1 Tax=Cryptotermes secundus TaxID=105785 RepID=UPI000CD7BB3B|nr:beta-glucuronidase isoform X2 [Cryptotermes secundus]